MESFLWGIKAAWSYRGMCLHCGEVIGTGCLWEEQGKAPFSHW